MLERGKKGLKAGGCSDEQRGNEGKVAARGKFGHRERGDVCKGTVSATAVVCIPGTPAIGPLQQASGRYLVYFYKQTRLLSAGYFASLLCVSSWEIEQKVTIFDETLHRSQPQVERSTIVP